MCCLLPTSPLPCNPSLRPSSCHPFLSFFQSVTQRAFSIVLSLPSTRFLSCLCNSILHVASYRMLCIPVKSTVINCILTNYSSNSLMLCLPCDMSPHYLSLYSFLMFFLCLSFTLLLSTPYFSYLFFSLFLSQKALICLMGDLFSLVFIGLLQISNSLGQE